MEKLISLGDLSVLAKEVEPQTNKHSFNTPEKDVCIFYGRDRCEKNVQASIYSNLDEAIINSGDNEYFFKEKNKTWYVSENNKLVDLKKALLKSEYVDEEVKKMILSEKSAKKLNKELDKKEPQLSRKYKV